jgi:hypothetical protein
MINAAKATLALLLVLSLSSTSCKKKQEPEGYRVVGFDKQTKQWTIIRSGTFDGKFLRKRLIVVCDFYKWGDHETVTGPDACNLQVGRNLVPNPFPPGEKRSELLDVWEMSADRLVIAEGGGSDKVEQQFIIQKDEVLPDR